MVEYFSIQIGGVDLNVGGEVPVTLDRSDVAYEDFLSTKPSASKGSLQITVTIADPRPPRSARKVWAAGDAWSLYRNGRQRFIDGPACLSAWSAEMEDDTVRVRCGPAMVRREGNQVTACNPVRYPLDQLLLMYALAQRRGVIVHACGAEFAGNGAIFLGRSGAGKSTLARLLADTGGCVVLSDDRMIVRMTEEGATMHGTPWPGEAGMAVNRSVPLTACFVLQKAEENSIEDLPASGVADALLPVASIPWYERDVAFPVLETCEAFAAAVPFRVLRFRKDEEAATMVCDAMRRGQQ